MIVPGAALPSFGGKDFPKVKSQQSGNRASLSPTTTVTIPTPAVGDLIVIIAAMCSTSFVSTTGPAGYTQRAYDQLSSTYLRTFGVYTKVSDGTETTATFSSSTNVFAAWNVFLITGHSAVEAATMVNGSSSTPDSPSFSPSWAADSTLWLSVMAHYSASAAVQSSPSGWTNFGQDVAVNGALEFPRVAWARKEEATATQNPPAFGGTPSGTFNGWMATTIAVKP